jgi:dihydrofolate reductase
MSERSLVGGLPAASVISRVQGMTVVHLINATLDGFCDHRSVIPDDDLHTHALSTIADADLLLYGAGTYRLLAPHWSQVAEEQSGSPTINEFATVLAAKPKIVFSSTAKPWPNWNSTVEDSDPTARVSQLLEGGAAKLVIQASPQLARTLRRGGLVTQLRLLMQPLVAGDGPTLFEPDERYEFTLTGIQRTRSGAAALDYEFH